MRENLPARPLIARHEWLGGLASDPVVGDYRLTDEEVDAVLDLARVAAHASERSAAPLAAFMAGMAVADRSVAERVQAIRSLIARIETA